MGWVVSWDSKWDEYSCYSEEGTGSVGNWATVQFLAFYGQPWNYHGACRGAKGMIFRVLMKV